MKRRNVKWIVLGIVVLFAGTLFAVTREPDPPYAFLKKYKIVDRRTTDDGRRLLIIEGDYQDVTNAARLELAGASKGMFVSTGSYTYNMMTTRYASFSSELGAVTVCSDLSGNACQISTNGFVTPDMSNPDNKPGYCAVSYTRPPSLFDKFLTWMRGFFGGSSGKATQTVSPIPPPSIQFPTRPLEAPQLSPARPERQQKQTPGEIEIGVGSGYTSRPPTL